VISFYGASDIGKEYYLEGKSYPKDDIAKVVPVTPGLSSRWVGIAAALLDLNIVRSRRGRVGDGETLVRRDRLDDNATCGIKRSRCGLGTR